MPTLYPTGVDTFPTNLNVPDVALAKTLRDMMDAIVALQTYAAKAQRTLRTTTVAYTLTDDDDIVAGDATGGAVTLTLPTAVGRAGRVFVAKKLDASGNAVTLDGAGAETVDGATTLALSAQWQTARVVSNGSAWLTI